MKYLDTPGFRCGIFIPVAECDQFRRVLLLSARTKCRVMESLARGYLFYDLGILREKREMDTGRFVQRDNGDSRILGGSGDVKINATRYFRR